MLNFDGSMKINVSMMLHGNCKLVALELHNNCSYILVIEMQKLHMYTISPMMNYIYCNPCNLFDNIHAHKNTSSCNELQMVIVIASKGNKKDQDGEGHVATKFEIKG
jgi:hypothetical protein